MRHLFILFLLFLLFNTALGQVNLIIIQTGKKVDTLPEVELVDHEILQYTKINDSTSTYLIDPKMPESLFIGIDPVTGWFTRIWLDPKVKSKEVILDHSTESTTIVNPNKDDVFYQQIFSYLMARDPSEGDSVLSKYVKAHPASYFSLHIVTHGLYRSDRRKLIDALYLIEPYFKDQPDFKRTKARLLDVKYPNIGDTFKEFSLNDINNSLFNSSSIKNKYILLNFWSNGCLPCVREMDSLVALYNSLDTSRIAFISISMDAKQIAWMNAKATNKIEWINLWQPGGGVGELCLHYNVHSMPFFILFDDQKKIEFIRYGAEELENIKQNFYSSGLKKNN